MNCAACARGVTWRAACGAQISTVKAEGAAIQAARMCKFDTMPVRCRRRTCCACHLRPPPSPPVQQLPYIVNP